jgi:hypothetical protein
MQLLLRRRILMGTRSSKFALWAKFEVADEDLRLIRHYQVSNCYLTIEASRRDFWRAGVISFFIALIGVSLFSAVFSHVPVMMASPRGMIQQQLLIPWWVWALIMAFVFSFGTWLIYEQLRLAIRIEDMLNGRQFKDKSLVLMARRERQMVGYAHAFVALLDKLKEWEGTDIIEIGQEDDHDRALRLITDTYHAAA